MTDRQKEYEWALSVWLSLLSFVMCMTVFIVYCFTNWTPDRWVVGGAFLVISIDCLIDGLRELHG